MSEIPEEVWTAADIAASEYWFGDHLSGRLKSIIAKVLLVERERSSNAIARAEKAEEALRVERERCAKIAEEAPIVSFDEDDLVKKIAAAIRTPPPVRETP